jgi:hypothetical protein
MSFSFSDLNPVKQIKKAAKWVKKQVRYAKEGSLQIGEALGFDQLIPDSNRKKRMTAGVEAPVIPLPDEEEIRRARRRRYASAPRSGRASTILTETDGDTPLGGY